MYNLTEKNIINILEKLREHSGISSSFLFTEDGFIIAIDEANFNEDEESFQSIAAICAGVISLAESGLNIVKDEIILKQIKIQAGNQLDDTGFMIIIQSITNEIIISVIFPNYLNLGVVLFELNQTIYKLGKYFARATRINHLEELNSLVKQS